MNLMKMAQRNTFFICANVLRPVTFAILVGYLLEFTTGNCIVDGTTYKNNSEWQANPCSVCRCLSPVALCEKVSCRDPQCDFKEGKYLKLAPNSCCPTCGQSSKGCAYQGHSVPHNAEFSSRPCETCLCDDGDIKCSNRTCPALACKPGAVEQQLPGECCRECVPGGRSCNSEGEVRPDGYEWEPLPCTKCVCRNGQSLCYIKQCPPVICGQNEVLQVSSKDCCPTCLKPGCKTGSKSFKDGETWQRDRCTHCLCEAGQLTCRKQSCDQQYRQCKPNEQLRWRRNSCCPECIPKNRAVCKEGIVHYYEGDMWNVSNCKFCICHNGQKSCSFAQCAKIKCGEDEEEHLYPGACCRRCISFAKCTYEGAIHKHGETWQKSSCERCACDNGQETCYTHPCEQCPPGTARGVTPGECCGQCKPASCGTPCASCNPPHPEICTGCKDTDRKLQSGKCVRKCGTGFFSLTQHKCQACHQSCASCAGDTDLHCATCKAGAILENGKCVSQCSSGYYEDVTSCKKCHRSCGTCYGRKLNQCSTCKWAWQVIVGSRCADYCGDGHYPNGNGCQVCGLSCQPCVLGDRGCKGCPNGLVLQQQLCVPRCDRRFSLDGRVCTRCPSKCLVCHKDRCDQCNGRSFLLEGRCVESCGEGYMASEDTRVCEANQFAPVLYENNTILAHTEGYTTVMPYMLTTSDRDTPFERLKFRIITPPGNGDLVKIVNGKDTVMLANAMFSSTELLEGRIRFHHDALKPLAGDVELWVSDASSGSPRQTVPITVTSLMPPRLIRNVPLMVDQDSIAVISADKNFDIQDDDSQAAVTVRVVEGPAHGDLVLLDDPTTSLETFSLDTLKAGQVVYSHNSSTRHQYDHLLFQASDGFNILNVLFHVEIRFKGNKAPQLVHNKDVFVEPSQMVQIIREDLEYESVGVQPNSDLVYTLTPPANNPKEGEILMVVPMPDGGPTEGWDDIGGGQMGAKMFRFLQRDINEGRIWYRHHGGKENSDFILFEVSDNANPPNVLREQEMFIVVVHPFIADTFNPLSTLDPYPETADTLPEGFHPETGPFHPSKPSVIGGEFDETFPDEFGSFPDDEVPRDSRRGGGLSEDVYSPPEELIPKPIDLRKGGLPEASGVSPGSREGPFPGRGEYEGRDEETDINSRGRFPGRDEYEDSEYGGREDEIEVDSRRFPPRRDEYEGRDDETDSNPLGTFPGGYGGREDEIEVDSRRFPGGYGGRDDETDSNPPRRRFPGGFGDRDDGIDSDTRWRYPSGRDLYDSEEEGTEFTGRYLPTHETFESEEEGIEPNPRYSPTHETFESEEEELEPTRESEQRGELPDLYDLATKGAVPTIALGVNLGMVVLENQVIAITRFDLAFTDTDSNDEDLVYHITRPLASMDGTVEHIERPFVMVLQFSQEDINENKILYRPPKEEVGIAEKTVSFEFALEDMRDGHSLPEHKFIIKIMPVNNAAPRFIGDSLAVVTFQGGTILIGPAVIKVADPDTRTQDLMFTLTELPSAGDFVKKTSKFEVVLRTGDQFTNKEIRENQFYYVHDGSDNLTDVIRLTVEDGVNTVPLAVTVDILKVDSHSPTPNPDATMTLLVTEDSSQVLEPSHIAFLDEGTPDSELKIILSSEPKHGGFFLRDSYEMMIAGKSFTQEDVNRKHVRYMSEKEIGARTISEVVYFNVTDPGGNKLPMQMFSISITPVNNQPPVATVGPGIQVDEGKRVTLTLTDISATDADTPIDLLAVFAEVLPSFGVLENTKKVAGSEMERQRRVMSFTLKDLVDGHIDYVQRDHRNKEPTLDAFLLHVSDGVSQSPTHKFNITINLINDEAPVLVTEQVFCLEGRGVLVNNASIYVVDIDSMAEDLIFTLTSSPRIGKLRKKSMTQQTLFQADPLDKGDIFTYQDVLQELLVYTHDGPEDVNSDQFSLSLTDGEFKAIGVVKVVIGVVNDETPRLRINRGLRVIPGSTTAIQSTELQATDVDSEDIHLKYIITVAPAFGQLQLKEATRLQTITVDSPHDSFKQFDIDSGRVEYIHSIGEPAGITTFKFYVVDRHGNALIDQTFLINVLEDRMPPEVLANKEMAVMEGSARKITTEFLSATDADSEPADLVFTVTQRPMLGHIAFADDPQYAVMSFTQSHLAASAVMYVHSSEEELYIDNFIFLVSDGTNQVVQKFYVTIIPVDDSLPLVTNLGLRVQEGIRKIITEFELKAVDKDTREDRIQFHIVSPPSHGQLQIERDDGTHETIDKFMMADIYDNKITYTHDGSDTLRDELKFTVSDGTNPLYKVHSDDGEVTVSRPQVFHIEVFPVDDGSPILVTNLGLHYLAMVDGRAMNFITKNELLTRDVDTLDSQIVYQVSRPPVHGQLENVDHPHVVIMFFTQDEVNNGLIRYVLTSDVSVLSDNFTFDLMDSKPNIVTGNVLHIQWSVITFAHARFNITETSGVIRIPIKRYGYLKQYSVVTCRTTDGTATSALKKTTPGLRDFTAHEGQVQFDEWQDSKVCTIVINDDSIYEGRETFYVELIEPAYTLIGKTSRAAVTISDTEDEPVIMFDEEIYAVNESSGHLYANLIRTGDSSIPASVICYTKSVSALGTDSNNLQSGSDFITRTNSRQSRVVFQAGVSMATCDIRIIDDSEYETMEQFEILLTSPSLMSRIGPQSQAIAIIEGPNDESVIFMSEAVYFVDEDAGRIEVPVVRQGTDLSHTSMVWCATRMSSPPSATPGQDYVPHSRKIVFHSGEITAMCVLDLLDDQANPRLEGNETFVVFLSSSVGSLLAEPQSALIIINDTKLDMPVLEFMSSEYRVDEENETVSVPVTRTGDLSYVSSVICYTRQRSASVAVDYDERTFTDDSRLTFAPGEKVKNCIVGIVNDEVYEGDERFWLKLASPRGTEHCDASLGQRDTTTVVITNKGDAPRIEIESPAYSVAEPESLDETSTLTVKVIRYGDKNSTLRVRCSTRDGSAISGIDYNARSRLLTFQPGVSSVEFPVEILHNSAVEWHETFYVALGPGLPEKAVYGKVSSAMITILDNEVSGSLILPAPPVVVSLLKYDDMENENLPNPSPGYPIICVTPCDPHHPLYSVTGPLCDNSGINESSIQYHWEAAMPLDIDGSRPPFERITTNTAFTDIHSKVLDAIYFRPQFQMRCVAQPLRDNGKLGVPLTSAVATIGTHNGICHTPVKSGTRYGLHAQSFVASLKYVEPSDPDHPNTIHTSIRIPHQDGMLPLVSTMPIHNLKLLLSETTYRQQHICSNFMLPSQRSLISKYGFLTPETTPTINDMPYQFDNTLRGNNTVQLYRHLNLKTCMWHFDAWYHMTELVDLCGGAVISDFEVRDAAHSYLTVRVPLYVSYVYTKAPTGWMSLEHRTELEFSFFYKTMHWRAGLETNGRLSAHLQVLKIIIGDDGNLVVDFKTKAKFRGQFVLDHHTRPNAVSRVVPPGELPISFKLSLVWSQQTFDSPSQIWRATSDYSLKDYSGDYVIELVPCTVTATQSFSPAMDGPLLCTAHEPQRYTVPISFQQTNRPVPLVYSLDTRFHLTSNKEDFLNPVGQTLDLDDLDADGTFTPDQTIYGRVMWNPAQDLDAAYKLQIEKLFICTGRDGFVPYYDPTGDVYNDGPQYGCLQAGPNIKHRFLVLDRGDPDVIDRSFNEVQFDARLADEVPEFTDLDSVPGVDGFAISVDPLYKVDVGHQWYLQVIYTIGPVDKLHERYRRSVSLPVTSRHRNKRAVRVATPNKKQKNGTNMHVLKLNPGAFEKFGSDKSGAGGGGSIVVPAVSSAISLLVLLSCLCCCFVCCRRNRRHSHRKDKNTADKESTRENNVNIYNGRTLKAANTTTSKTDPITSSLKGKDSNIRIHKNEWTRPKSGTEV